MRIRLPISLPVRDGAHSRHGVALVMFVVLVFAFFAIAGVAIDVGMASLTQQQMQVAVDPAAMEGVRLRDYSVYQHISDPNRRPRVSNLVRLVFDDDLHPTGGTQDSGTQIGQAPDDPDRLQLGAGPFLRITDKGAGPLAPGGVIGVPSTPTWDDPILQGNMLPGPVIGNFDNGDMVSGTYHDDQPHTEPSNYERPDFTRGLNGTSGTWEALGFLVRMRRTTGANPFDDQPGKASHGPTIPFLFGLGSLMVKDANNSWDPRRDGMTVRATAIAVARPALRASPTPMRPDPANPGSTIPVLSENDAPAAILGLHPIALQLDLWTSWLPGGTWGNSIHDLTIGAGGALLDGSGATRGFLVQPSAVTSVGIEITPDASANIQLGLRPGYVAIYAPVGPAATNRVIGYGFMDAGRNALSTLARVRPGILSSGPGSESTDVRVWVAPNGVSAQIGFDTPALSKPDWDDVFRLNRILAFGGDNNLPDHDVIYDHTRIRPGTLLAPALAR